MRPEVGVRLVGGASTYQKGGVHIRTSGAMINEIQVYAQT